MLFGKSAAGYAKQSVLNGLFQALVLESSPGIDGRVRIAAGIYTLPARKNRFMYRHGKSNIMSYWLELLAQCCAVVTSCMLTNLTGEQIEVSRCMKRGSFGVPNSL